MRRETSNETGECERSAGTTEITESNSLSVTSPGISSTEQGHYIGLISGTDSSLSQTVVIALCPIELHTVVASSTGLTESAEVPLHHYNGVKTSLWF